MEQTQLAVKEVAIYLRKSRDETNGQEDVLAKHEALLLEYAQKHNLKYRIYKEIGSAESIDSRPEMMRLLEDVAQDLYDAVLVVDIDRLSRGGWIDRGRMQEVLSRSSTLVITPSRAYDFNNDDEQIMTDIELVFANHEYRMIKKRMVRGKKQGAKAGKWVNGKPPFPYVYNRVTKELDVDEDNLKIYDLMKLWFLDDQKRCFEISHSLNNMGSRTPSGKFWSEVQVHRILTSEVHLGKVIYGKTSGSGHAHRNTKPLQPKDRSQWIVEEGSHPQLKTYEEHERIMALLEARKIKPRASRSTVQVLSKLLFCGQCGGALQFLNRKNGAVHVKKCQKSDPFGNRCTNSGANVEVVYAGLMAELQQFEHNLVRTEPESDLQDNSTLEIVLSNKRTELQDLINGLDRIEDLYIDGRMEKARYVDRTGKQQQKIQSAREDIANLEKSLAIFSNVRTNEERIEAITAFKEKWNAENIDNAELNRLARALIDRIEFVRDGDNIQLNVKFI